MKERRGGERGEKNDVRRNIVRRNNVRTNNIRSKIRAGRYKIV